MAYLDYTGLQYYNGKVQWQISDLKEDLLYINFSKANFPIPPNILNRSRIKDGGFINGNTGAVVQGESGTGLNCYTDFISVENSETYYVYPHRLCNAVFYDSLKNYISGGVIDVDGVITTPATASYIRMSFVSSQIADVKLSVSKIQGPNEYFAHLNNISIKSPHISSDNMMLGTKATSTPYTVNPANTRCVTGFIWLENTRIIKATDNKMAVYIYSDSLTFESAYEFAYFSQNDHVDINGGKYCVFVFAFSDDRTITAEDFPTFASMVQFEQPAIAEITGISAYLLKPSWRNGSLGNPFNATAVSTVDIIPRSSAESITVVVDEPLTNGNKYRFQISTYSVPEGITADNVVNRITQDWTVITTQNYCTFPLIDNSVGFAVSLYMFDANDNYVPLRITSFDTDSIKINRNFTGTELEKDFIIGSGFEKTPIRMKNIGTLSATQSFCVYDNSFYSTDGSNLYEQDSSFTLISTTALSLGHGNSLQLGNNGLAYVSGWNDGKVYVVDLENKSIVDTITLPTLSGYTTCAVDDVNKLIYIFNGSSESSTGEVYYDFVVYDYDNDTIVSTKKLTRAFGAMQSCDFINGKIFATYGLGTDTIPNGYIILNTNGDIISEYIIDSQKTNEPEGVFVDRTTFDIYLSYLNKKVYKVTT